jgi:hypothetical protein
MIMSLKEKFKSFAQRAGSASAGMIVGLGSATAGGTAGYLAMGLIDIGPALGGIFLGAAGVKLGITIAEMIDCGVREFGAGALLTSGLVAAHFAIQSPSAPDSPVVNPTPVTAVQATKPAAYLKV